MSKKTQRRGFPELPSSQMEARIRKALHEGRTQQALELAKQLHKQEPTEAHVALLRQAYQERARQLQSQGYTKDAATVLENLLQLGPAQPQDVEHLAQNLAGLGNIGQALKLADGLSEPAQRLGIVGHVVDAALRTGDKGRKQLPEALQAGYDFIVRAFAETEQGHDDAARELLQGIGLQSPYLEWKVFLRGLIAYYQQDDARAIENWQRLSGSRLPGRLSAPLRFQIDPAFRNTFSPEALAALQRATAQLQGTSTLQSLRALQTALSNREHLPQALRLADGVAAMIRQQAPHLLPRLAYCFYWAVVHHGYPEDIVRYQRTFGAPPDDPQLDRMKAMQFENAGELPKAHAAWRKFEQSVAQHPEAWTKFSSDGAAVVPRIRALIWSHMGQNAASVPDIDKIPGLPSFLRDHPSAPRPLSPGAEECFRHSIELAPDRLQSHLDLFLYYRNADKRKKAEEVGRRLLERFPDQAATQEALADLYMEEEKYDEGLALLQSALKANPLERRLRIKLSAAHLYHAYPRVQSKNFDEARADYQAALALNDSKDNSAILCKWAACEFKAGQPEAAEALLERARANGSPVTIAYRMLAESIRLKLPKPVKSRFEKEFPAGLAEPPTGLAAATIAHAAAGYALSEKPYYGQKTHEKKILAFIDKARRADFTDEQLTTLCRALNNLEANKALEKFAALGQKQFPENAFFHFMEAEAFIARGPARCPMWRLGPLLDRAQQLAAKLPDDRRAELLDLIEERKRMIGLTSGLMGLGGLEDMFESFFDAMGDDDMEFEDEEEFGRSRRRRR